ncbi:hypothetical protein JCM15519_38470 [Fundidesulfovibrio butyratiphilus]
MRRLTEHTDEAATALVDTWNLHYPIGTEVKVVKDRGEVLETRTRSQAWITPSGGVLVMIVGISGGYSLSRVIPIPQA